MPTLDDVARHQSRLHGADIDWLHLLVADWQILADLSFADLVLWLPDAEERGFWAAAQIRPTTAATAHVDDLVGDFVPWGKVAMLERAYEERRIVREGDPEWREAIPVRIEAIPVCHAGSVIAVIARETNLLGVRTPSRLELSYLRTAAELAIMITEGTFPVPGERSDLSDSPRVGDGLLRTDADGVVRYASPNAMSAYRRIGMTADLVGSDLAQVTHELIPATARATDSALSSVARGSVAQETELESATASLLLRSIPLRSDGRRSGALLLLRDVTELRRRERELISREATIREIHHRVKNNLQTVAALLRLQARRLDVPEGRQALEEAVRRVGSIALVHETLSRTIDESVEFDDIVDRLRVMVVDVSSSVGEVRTARSGSFGVLPAEVATPLAMVLTELLQNAAEHAFSGEGGSIVVAGRREQQRVEVVVEDDGYGLPADLDVDSYSRLGMSIVSTLVESELGGTLAFEAATPGATRPGTRVVVGVPLS